jgi:hypothetical protein
MAQPRSHMAQHPWYVQSGSGRAAPVRHRKTSRCVLYVDRHTHACRVFYSMARPCHLWSDSWLLLAPSLHNISMSSSQPDTQACR